MADDEAVGTAELGEGCGDFMVFVGVEVDSAHRNIAVNAIEVWACSPYLSSLNFIALFRGEGFGNGVVGPSAQRRDGLRPLGLPFILPTGETARSTTREPPVPGKPKPPGPPPATP